MNPGIKWFVRIATALHLVSTAIADDGFWSRGGGGSWANAGNWDGGTIADGTDNAAYFGFSLYPDIPASATFTLDGARTIGNVVFTDRNGPDTWSLNTGTAGPLTLDYTFDTASITVQLASQTVTVNAVLAGTAGLEKLGDGTLVLSATNTYTGQTIVSSGALRMNGRIGLDGVDVVAGSLGGTGVISGPVIIESGAILSPGNSLGTLTISNTLTLQPGSTTVIEVNAATLDHDALQGLSGVSYGGSMVVSNLGGALTLGQNFPIFNSTTSSGNFSSITPNPGIGLRWRFDPSNGALSVVSSASQPRIASITRAGTNVVLRVTNGPPGATNYLLTSTNVAVPAPAWSRSATNTFDPSGSLTSTNPMKPSATPGFYRISVPVLP